jgi:N-formylglutamate amidohydrolase
MHRPIVLHIPHSSVLVPPDVAFLLSTSELADELVRMTDRYTDELFALAPDVATAVVYPVSRLVVDPERFPDDADEPMSRKGMGAVYTRTSDGRPLRAEPSAPERQRLLARFYEPHHARLTAAVDAALAAHGRCLIVDGHSFPSRPLPYEDDQELDRPDICIGTDAFHTTMELRERAVRAFEAQGWRVAVDRPFSGALVPTRFYQTEPHVQSVMVEVNRGLYMDERAGGRLDSFGGIVNRIREALAKVFGVTFR